ncbi:MAG TPA: hypothetical protein PKY81_12960 [bacterium]|nr:hypothetical protein [bacterium]HPN31856.1 hypothetical protein [bacterium]
MKKSGEYIIISITVVLGVLLPFAFHFIAAGGKIFLPMYYPIIISGFLLEPTSALIAGFLTPFISSFITGMPTLNPPVAFQMSIELSILGFLVSFLSGKLKFNYHIVCVISILINRILYAGLYFVITRIYNLPFKTKVIAELTSSIPGVLIIFLALPSFAKFLKKKLFQSESIYNR